MPVEVLLRFTAMGDLLLAIPAARALAARGSQVHWVIHRRWAPLAPFLPARVHLGGEARDLLPLARRLRALNPARVHDLQGKPVSIVLAALMGCLVTRYRKRNFWENLRVARGEYPLRAGDPQPVWKRYLDVVGEPDAPPAGALALPPERLVKAETWIREEMGFSPRSFTVFHPGASHPGKVLSKSACQAFLEVLPNPVVIGDNPRPALPGRFVDLRGRLPLDRLPGVIALSQGMVSSDSGPMHLAAAVGVPLAGIFIQTDPSLGFSPLPSRRTKVISRPLPCKPCSLHGQRLNCPEGHWACRDLPWRDLAAEVAEFLEAAA